MPRSLVLCCLLPMPCSLVPCCPLPAPAPHSRHPMLPYAMLSPPCTVLPPPRVVLPPPHTDFPLLASCAPLTQIQPLHGHSPFPCYCSPFSPSTGCRNRILVLLHCRPVTLALHHYFCDFITAIPIAIPSPRPRHPHYPTVVAIPVASSSLWAHRQHHPIHAPPFLLHCSCNSSNCISQARSK